MPTVIVGQEVTKISAYPVQTVDRGMIPVSDLSPPGSTWTAENSVVARAPGAEGAVLRKRLGTTPHPDIAGDWPVQGEPQGSRRT